jgi:hypothetical protein
MKCAAAFFTIAELFGQLCQLALEPSVFYKKSRSSTALLSCERRALLRQEYNCLS